MTPTQLTRDDAVQAIKRINRKLRQTAEMHSQLIDKCSEFSDEYVAVLLDVSNMLDEAMHSVATVVALAIGDDA